MAKQKTLTRADLAEMVYHRIGLSRTESSRLVNLVLEEILDALVEDQHVKLSSFGIFRVHKKNRRMGRNPKTGENFPIAPRRVISFRASNILRNKVYRGFLRRTEAPNVPEAGDSGSAGNRG